MTSLAGWRAAAITTLMLFMVSCGSLAPAPDASSHFKQEAFFTPDAAFTPGPDTVVLYGHFGLIQFQEIPGFCLDILHEETEQEQFMPFKPLDPVYCLVSRSGTQDIIGVATIGSLGRPVRYLFKGSDGPRALSFNARPGTALYVGDFTGIRENHGMYTQLGIRSITNNFAETTEAFHKKYPNLAGLPVQSVFDDSRQAVTLSSSNTVPAVIPVPAHVP